jgi:Fic family protein
MTMDASEPLTPDQAAAIDTQYTPLPRFAEWPQVAPRPDAWEARLDAFAEAKAVADQAALQRATREAMRAAAFETGAIENLYPSSRGLTFTVATQAAAWEATVRSQAPNALDLFQAQLRTYELVLDAATNGTSVSEAWIRRLHEELTGPQETYTAYTPVGPQEQTLPRGVYKQHPNHVQTVDGEVHAYAPVADTAPEMARFVAELSSSEFEDASPVLQAAYAHYCLVAIHPFADGNGRVARALASVYFYRSVGVPLLIFADERPRYFGSLRVSDNGDREPFVQFVAAAGRSALELVSQGLRTAAMPVLDELTQSLRQLLTAQPDLTLAEMIALGPTVADELTAISRELLDELELPSGVSIQPYMGGGKVEDIPPGFMHSGEQRRQSVLGLTADSAPPVEAHEESQVEVLVSDRQDQLRTFLLVRTGEADTLELEVSDLHPEVTASARYRLRLYAQRWIASLLTRLNHNTSQLLESETTLDAIEQARILSDQQMRQIQEIVRAAARDRDRDAGSD